MDDTLFIIQNVLSFEHAFCDTLIRAEETFPMLTQYERRRINAVKPVGIYFPVVSDNAPRKLVSASNEKKSLNEKS